MSDKDNKNKHNEDTAVAASRRKTTRRQVLQAGAAAPVVYTLASGKALAATSMLCEDKDGGILQLEQQGQSENYKWPGTNTQAETSGAELTHPITGQKYVHQGQGKLITASCWNSINVSSSTINWNP